MACQCGNLDCVDCYMNQSPKFLENVFQSWDRHFRENLKMIMAMTPEELKLHTKHREEQERKDNIKRELERAKRKMWSARENLKMAKDAARKAGIL
jgi:hypothetical protein